MFYRGDFVHMPVQKMCAGMCVIRGKPVGWRWPRECFSPLCEEAVESYARFFPPAIHSLCTGCGEKPAMHIDGPGCR